MAIIVRDTFTDTNGVLMTAHTPNISPNSNKWTGFAQGSTVSGSITSNQAVITQTPTGNNAGYAIDSSKSDCIITALVVTITGSPFVVFRYNPANGSYFYVQSGAIFWYSGSSFTNLGSISSFTANCQVVITLSGSSISVSINGGTPVTITNTNNQTMTSHGIGTGNSSCTFDNFTVEDLSTVGYDGFDRSASTTAIGRADTGQTWTVSGTGAYGIDASGNAYCATKPSSGHNVAYIDTKNSDGIMQCTFVKLNDVSGGGPKLGFRIQDSENMVMCQVMTTNILVYYYKAGAGTNLAQYNGTINNGDIIKVKAVGTAITVYQNGNQVLTTTDTSPFVSNTKWGIMAYNYTSARYKNFQFDTIPVGNSYLITLNDSFSISDSIINGSFVASSSPPNVNILSLDHRKISNKNGMNQANLVFSFDTNVTGWIVNVLGTSPSSGTLVSSGGAVTLGNNVTIPIPYGTMYQEGSNQVNIYGLNASGWTPYLDSNGTNNTGGTNAKGLPFINKVMLVIMENHAQNELDGNPSAPYFNSLLSGGANFKSMSAIEHPSQPNYFDIFSGINQGCTNDNYITSYSINAPNLYTVLNSAGSTFTSYNEDMPYIGFTGDTNLNYASKHNPWTKFSNVPSGNNLPFAGYFPSGNFGSLSDISIVVPNLINDIHDGTINQGDVWLQTNIDPYVQWAKNNNSLLIVTFDEDDGSLSNIVPFVMVGPMVKQGINNTAYNHYSLMRTLIDLKGGTSYPANSATAKVINDAWTVTSGGASTYTYLSLDGTTGYISIPSMTVTDVYINFEYTAPTNNYNMIYESSANMILWHSDHLSGYQTMQYSSPGTDVVQTANAMINLHGWSTTAWTSTATIGKGDSAQQSSINMPMQIYDIKFWNGTTIVAHYDMTTGTLNDQTGNGNNATLNGSGTWH
jgi:hypothetical protein